MWWLPWKTCLAVQQSRTWGSKGWGMAWLAYRLCRHRCPDCPKDSWLVESRIVTFRSFFFKRHLLHILYNPYNNPPAMDYRFFLRFLCSFLSALGLSAVRALGSQGQGPPLAAVCRLPGARPCLVMAPGLTCSVAHGVFPDQRWSLCPLRWQVDS